MPPFENFLDKVKNATKQAPDQFKSAARMAKLKMNVVSLNSEKNKHFQTIGLRVYSLHKENSAMDGNVIKDKVKDEINQISRIDEKINELEAEIASLQSHAQHVDVTDVTDDEEQTDSEQPSEPQKE